MIISPSARARARSSRERDASHVRAQTLALASTLALDGSRDSGTFDQSNAPSLLDQYDYAMYGKLYKWKQVRPAEGRAEQARA